MSKKAIIAIINGELYIDPSDVDKLNAPELKKQLREKYGEAIKVNVAPIKDWMPASGTEALMKEAMEEMALAIAAKDVKSEPIMLNRKARRRLDSLKKRK
jgi:hypothetical protein